MKSFDRERFDNLVVENTVNDTIEQRSLRALVGYALFMLDEYPETHDDVEANYGEEVMKFLTK